MSDENCPSCRHPVGAHHVDIGWSGTKRTESYCHATCKCDWIPATSAHELGMAIGKSIAREYALDVERLARAMSALHWTTFQYHDDDFRDVAAEVAREYNKVDS